MGKKKINKVAKKKLFGLTKEALETLAANIEPGKTETDALHDLIVSAKFLPHVEAAILERQKEHKLTRQRAIESMLAEYVAFANGGQKPTK